MKKVILLALSLTAVVSAQTLSSGYRDTMKNQDLNSLVDAMKVLTTEMPYKTQVEAWQNMRELGERRLQELNEKYPAAAKARTTSSKYDCKNCKCKQCLCNVDN